MIGKIDLLFYSNNRFELTYFWESGFVAFIQCYTRWFCYSPINAFIDANDGWQLTEYFSLKSQSNDNELKYF